MPERAAFLVETLVRDTNAVVGGVLKSATLIARELDLEITWPTTTFSVDK